MYPRPMTATPPSEALTRLAQYVERRIAELVLEYAEVCRRAEISDETLIKIRKGLNARASTYRKLERALQWQQGSIGRILAGGEPTPLEAAGDQPQGEDSPPAPAGAAFSPGEALRRVVRSSALEFGVTVDALDAVFQAVRQDLGGEDVRGAANDAAGARVRTDLSDLVRAGRRAAGLSLQEVADHAVDPSSGERVIDAAWLDRLEHNALDPSEYPEYPQTDALVELLGLDPVAVQDAAGVQFHGVHTIWSEDGRVRGFSIGELTDPEDIAKARALMEEYGRPLRRRRDG